MRRVVMLAVVVAVALLGAVRDGVGAEAEPAASGTSSPASPDGTCPAPPPGEGQTPAAESASPAAKPGKGVSGLPEVGATAKPFSLPDLQGKPVAFGPTRLELPTLLVFWSIFCEPCKDEISMYSWAGEKYGPQGLRILAVNLDGSKMNKAVANFVRMQNLALAVVLDRKNGNRLETADLYGVTGTPSLILVGRDGRVRWAHRGRIGVEDFEKAIQKALSS